MIDRAVTQERFANSYIVEDVQTKRIAELIENRLHAKFEDLNITYLSIENDPRLYHQKMCRMIVRHKEFPGEKIMVGSIVDLPLVNNSVDCDGMADEVSRRLIFRINEGLDKLRQRSENAGYIEGGDQRVTWD